LHGLLAFRRERTETKRKKADSEGEPSAKKNTSNLEGTHDGRAEKQKKDLYGEKVLRGILERRVG
jgi:hypothetical protein